MKKIGIYILALFAFVPRFSNAATRTIANGGGNWNVNGTWVENAVPTSADDVVATATSGNLTINAAAVCRSIDLTGYVRTLTHNTGTPLTIGDGTAGAGNNALVFPSSGWTYTLGSLTTSSITFITTSATAQTVDFSGKVIGNISFNGAGAKWNLTGSQTSSANTITLTAGTLNVNNAGTFGSGTLTIAGAVILDNTSGSPITLSGNNTQNWNANFTFTGTNDLNMGTGAVALGATRGLTINGGNFTVDGIISGGGFGITKSGVGTLILTGNNSFTGVVTLSAGTLRATTSANALGTGAATLALNGGTLQLADNTGLNFARNTTVGGAATITSDRTSSGAGVTNTLGTLSIGNQTLTISVGGNVASGTAGITFGATTLSASTPTFDIDSGALLTLGALGGNMNIVKQDVGQLTLNGASGRASGSTTLSAGTLKVSNVSGVGAAACTLLLNGGTLELATDLTVNAHPTTVGGNTTIASNRATSGAGVTHTLGTLSIGNQTLNITVGGNVTSGTAGVTFGATTLSASTPTFDIANSALLTLGALGGNFNIIKQNSGQLTVNGASGRAGGSTTLTAGTLKVATTNGLGTAVSTLVLNGGTLELATDLSVNAHPTTVGGNVTIVSNRATNGAGITHTLGTLGIGNQTLNITAGSAVTSGTAGVTFGVTTLSASTPIFDEASGTLLTLGAIGGNFDFTKQGAGQLTLNAASLRSSGVTTLTAGTMRLSNATALGTTATTINLNGGTLDLFVTLGVSAYPVTVGGNATIASNRATAGNGVTHTLGTLSIGDFTLNAIVGSNVTGSSSGLTFGAVTLTGNPTFDVLNSAVPVPMTVTLGAVDDGTTARAITKSNNGTLTLGTAATSLVDGTTININGGRLNSNNITAVGALAVVDVVVNSTFSAGASQTVGAITNGGRIVLGANTLTVGGANNLSCAFSGITSGTGGITKAGSGTLTLSGPNAHTGATTLSAGTLRATTSTNALGAGTLVLNGGTLELADDSGLNFGRNTTIGGAATIVSDRITSGAGVTNTLGTLSIGNFTLNINAGSNVTSGTAGVTFGATTLSANTPVFDTPAGTLLTLGALSGNSRPIIKQNSGQLTLNTASAKTLGSATLNGGTLVLAATTALGTTSNSLVLNSGTLVLDTDASMNAYPTTIGGAVNIISDRATNGAGMIHTLGTLSIGSFTPNFTVGSNVASGNQGVAFGATTLTGNPTFDIQNGVSPAIPLNVALGAVNDGGAVARTITKENTGTLTFASAATSLINGTQININAGTVTSTSTTGVGALASIDIVAGSTFSVGANQVVGAVTDNGFIYANGFTLTIGGANNLSCDFPGTIYGSGGITKAGSGTLTLSGDNSYSGTTTLSAGTLRVTTSADALGLGALQLNGGILQLADDTGLNWGRNTTIGGATTINSDRVTSGAAVTHTLGTLSIGNTTLNITVGGNVTSGTAGVTFGDVTLSANTAILNVASNALLTGGALIGNFNLTKQNSGQLTLGTASGRSAGITTLTAGTLYLGDSAALGTAATTLALNGGILDLASDLSINAHNTTVGGAVTIVSDRETPGAGVTHTLGTLGIGNQTLTISSGTNVTSGSPSVTFGATTLSANTSVFDVDNNLLLTLGALGGSFNISKTDTGQLTLNGASGRLSGSATLSAGTLKLSNTAGLGAAACTLLLNGGTLELATDSTVNAHPTTIGGAVNIISNRATSGAGFPHILGTLSIGTFSPNFTVGGGVASGSQGVTFGNTTFTGNPTFNIQNSVSPAIPLNVTFGAVTDGAVARTITKENSGTLTFGSAATSLINGTQININAGTLASTNGTGVGALASIDIVAGSTFSVGANQVVGAVTDNGFIYANGFTLTIGGANNLSCDFPGTIYGTGGITKAGIGTVILSGDNSYSGTTTLSAGTLRATTNANALGIGALQLNGGILQLADDSGLNFARNTTIGGATTINSDRMTAGAGVTNTLGTLSIGNLTLNITVGGNVTSGTAAVTFGNTSLTANTGVMNVASNALLTLGALSGNFNLTKQNGGQLTLATASGRSAGITTLTAGTLYLGDSAALGTAATTLALNGGILDLASDLSINAHNTTVGGAVTIVSDRATPGAGVPHTLGTLGIGNQTLTISSGTNVTSGSPSVTFGATTLSANTPVFDVDNNLLLTLGALGGNININKTDTGQLTLNGASTRATGSTTLSAGTLKISNTAGVGAAACTLLLNSGTLELATDLTVNAHPTTISGAVNIISNRATGGAGFAQTLGTLSIGAFAPNFTVGSNVTSGNQGVTFGATTLTGNPTLAVANNVSPAIPLNVTFGAVTDGGAVARTITKENSGTLTFGSAATSLINGTQININAGTFASNNATGVGALASIDIVAASTFSVGANQVVGAVTNSGSINLNGSVLTIGGANNLSCDFPGYIYGTGGITKAGNGTVTLSGNNGYTGVTTLSAGTLRATTSANALGTGAATLQLNGGILQLADDSGLNFARNTTVGGAVTITSDRTSSGAGVTNTLGTLGIGNQTLTISVGSNVTSGAAGITFGATTLSGSTPIFDVDSGGLLTLGALGGNFNIVKQDVGQLTLNGASGRASGSTTLTAGTLKVSNASGVGAAACTLLLNGGTLDLAVDSSVNSHPTTVGGAVTIVSDRATAGAGVTHTLGTLGIGNQTLTISSGTNVTSGSPAVTFGATTLSANTSVFDVDNNLLLTLGALGGNFNIAKQDTGQLTLNGASGRSAGSTTLTAGTLKIATTNGAGTAATTLLLNGGILDLAVDSSVNAHPTTVGGAVTIVSDRATPGAGVTHTLGTLGIGNQTLTISSGANVTSGSPAVTFGATTLSANTSVFDVDNNLLLTLGALGGNFDISKTDTGQLTLNGASGRSAGSTTLTAGTLKLATANGAGTAATTLLLNGGILDLAVNSTVNAHPVTVGGDATVVSNRSSSGPGIIHSLGTLSIGEFTLNTTVGSNVTSGSAGLTFGAVTLTGNPTFYVLNTAIPSTCTLPSAIGGSFGFTKNGNGTLYVSGANDFTGNVLVNAGRLNIQNNTALGTTAGSATVAGGAQLQIQGNITVGAEALSLNGSGIASDGAIRNLSGNNTWQGPVTLGSASTLDSDAGTLTLSGALDAGGFDLTSTGAGNTTLSGTVSSINNLTLTHTGSGVLSLSGNAIDVNGNYSLSSGGFNQATGSMTVAGNFSIANGATFTKSSNAWALAFDGTGNLTDSNASKQDLGIVVASGTTATRTLATDTKMTRLTINSGDIFALAGNNFTFNAAAAVSNSGTFRLNGNETLTNVNNLGLADGQVEYVGLAGPYNVKDFGATDYWDLKINGSGAVFNGGSAKTIANKLDVANGTFNTQGADLSVSSTTSQSNGTITLGGSAVTLQGDLNRTGGIFNYDTSTVTFATTGIKVLSGNTTFYGLRAVTSGQTLKFTSGTTHYVTHMVEFRSVTLRSTIDNATWYFTYTGSSQTLAGLSVQDSNASGGSPMLMDDASNDLGNNRNWIFGNPGAINNFLAVPSFAPGAIDLTWNAQGNDGSSGILNNSTFTIQYTTMTAFATSSSWSPTDALSANVFRVHIATTAVAAGSAQGTTIVTLAEGDTYYFRIWTKDNSDKYSDISNGATNYATRALLSIFIDTDTFAFGQVPQASTAVASSSITITNNGNVGQKYQINLTNPAGWTAVSTPPGTDQFRFSTVFTTTTPTGPRFTANDVLTTVAQPATSTNFAVDSESDTVKGIQIPANGQRGLWFKFESPTLNNVGTQQNISITITAQPE